MGGDGRRGERGVVHGPTVRRLDGSGSGRDRGAAESRRAFLERMSRTSVVLVCVGGGGFLTGCASFPRVTPVREGAAARIPLSAFAGTSGVLFDFPEEDMPVYVHRHGPDRFSAVLTRCAHRGCEVDPTPERMVCPCHGSEYTHTGALLEGPADGPLTSYATERDGDWVVVRLAHGGSR